MRKSNDLGEALVTSMGEQSLREIAVELGDIALDAFTDEGLLKEVPVVGWVAKAVSAARSVSDRLFLRKVAMFLQELSSVSSEERARFIERIDSDPGGRRKVGETVALLLDRHDRFEKSALLGRLMAAVVGDELEYRWFTRMSAVLDRCSLEDLEQFLRIREIPHISQDIEDNLYRAGLLDLEIKNFQYTPEDIDSQIRYRIGHIGELFLRHLGTPLKAE